MNTALGEWKEKVEEVAFESKVQRNCDEISQKKDDVGQIQAGLKMVERVGHRLVRKNQET